MGTVPSAQNQDPTLYCAYFGGPCDGFKSGDMPATLSGQPLTGMVSKTPLSEPHYYSLYAVYECTSHTQVNGFWEFHYRGLEGPNGEQLGATQPEPASSTEPDLMSIAEFEQQLIAEFEQAAADLGMPTNSESNTDT